MQKTPRTKLMPPAIALLLMFCLGLPEWGCRAVGRGAAVGCGKKAAQSGNSKKRAPERRVAEKPIGKSRFSSP